MNTLSRTLLIDARLANPTAGGIGRYVFELGQRLAHVLPNWTLSALASKGIVFPGIVSISACRNPRTFRGMSEVSGAIRRLRPDLVHFPHPFIPPLGMTRPFVVTIHDLIPFHYPSRLASTHGRAGYIIRKVLEQAQLSFIRRKARQIVTVSQSSRRDLIAAGFPATRITNIPLASDHLALACLSPTCTFKSPIASFFLIVGALYPHKNVELLLELAQDFPQLSLIRCGPQGVFSKRISHIAWTLGLIQAGRYLDLGEISDHELSHLIADSRALIQASLMEGFCLPVMEAVRWGKPIMASVAGSIPEVAGLSVHYIQPFDRSSIRNCLREFMTSAPPTMPKIGFERQWDDVALETARLYETLALSA